MSKDKYERAKQERQKHVDEVLNSPSMKKLVVAGPGTGKTYLFKQILEGKKTALRSSERASWALAAGESPEWIAGTLGRVNTSMVYRTYGRYIPNLTRHDGSAFEGFLSGP